MFLLNEKFKLFLEFSKVLLGTQQRQMDVKNGRFDSRVGPHREGADISRPGMSHITHTHTRTHLPGPFLETSVVFYGQLMRLSA
jgi:hypothetical protein